MVLNKVFSQAANWIEHAGGFIQEFSVVVWMAGRLSLSGSLNQSAYTWCPQGKWASCDSPR